MTSTSSATSASSTSGPSAATSASNIGYQHFERKIYVPPFDSPLLYDNNTLQIKVNQSEVGAVLTVKWNAGLFPMIDAQQLTGQKMFVSLKERNTTLVSGNESIGPSIAWVVVGSNNSRVAEITFLENGTFTQFYPKNATLVGNQVYLNDESSLYPHLKYLRVSPGPFTTAQSYLGPSYEYHAETFDFASKGWTYVIEHPGDYSISYRFTEGVLRNAAMTYDPILAQMFLVSMQQNGKTLSEQLDTSEAYFGQHPATLVRGSWDGNSMVIRVDQQYILFPQGTMPTTFRVTWNSTRFVDMVVGEDTLNGSLVSYIPGSSGGNSSLAINATAGVYWLIFLANSGAFIDGGYIQFNVQYPNGVNVVTYFEPASSYI
ncbi:MAG: hypothetical protein OK452_06995 [Thaumarchaeota archaeon]|nr:hypothetical protein [Nitrososphaerota archaeon]